MSTINWQDYPNFDAQELACKHCGAEGITSNMMDILQGIRTEMAQPIFLSSGYRCLKHPVEQEKDKPGEHTHGMAVDILCHGARALEIIKLAQARDVKRIGIHQKGNPNGRFVHIGIADRYNLAFPVAIWTY
jgi:uncharacterized protein YcbK (DUF882 family)